MTRAARLSRAGDASRPHLHRRGWHGGARGGKGPADLAKAAKKGEALEPGGLGRGRKRKQPLVTLREAARKRLQGHGGRFARVRAASATPRARTERKNQQERPRAPGQAVPHPGSSLLPAPARRGAGSGGEGYTWLQERR